MISYATIDHALGNPKGRYFGQGHRSSVDHFSLGHLERGTARGLGAVHQEGLWSTKETGVVSRHLSTIDAISLAGVALESVLSLEPVTVEHLFVTTATIRSGSAATEDLTAIPIEANAEWDATRRAFSCSVRVGSIKLELRIETIPATFGSVTADEEANFYASHLRRRIQHISDININLADVECTSDSMSAKMGTLAVENHNTVRYTGLQAAHAELFSASEAVVCLAQLGQTLAYEYDRISRDESAVFWLRRMSVEISEPRLRVGQLIDVSLNIEKSSELRIQDERFRSLRLSAKGMGITAIADVAHALPDDGRES